MDDFPAPVRPDRLAPDVALPMTWRIDRLELAPAQRPADPSDLVGPALDRPLASLPLSELVGLGSRVTIVAGGAFTGISDLSMIPPIIEHLRRADVRADDISILIANESGHPSAARVLPETLGLVESAVGRIVVNDPGDHASHTSLGSVEGFIVRAHHLAVEADLLIATGAVAPDEYTGYSGGSDVVALGCVDDEALRALRSARFLDDVGVRAGKIRENSFQRTVREIGRRAGLLFVVNALLDPESCAPVAVVAGAPVAVHDALVAMAAPLYESEAPGARYDVVVLTEEDDRRRTLYNASPGISAVTLAPRPVLRTQGVLIAQAQFADTTAAIDGRITMLRPSSSQGFYRALEGAVSADVLLRQLRSRGLAAGEERAYRVAQAMSAGAHLVLCDPHWKGGQGFGFSTARTIAEAAEIAESYVGRRPRALIVPQRGGRLPVPSERPMNASDNPFGDWAADDA
ncbi:MAG: lactate racemase domain-containing protein [Thermoflexales bacterium]